MIYSAFAAILLSSVANGRRFDNNEYYAADCNKNSSSCSIVMRNELQRGEFHAFAMYKDDISESGWGKLWVHGDSTSEGWYQSGFLEGALTSQRVYQHFKSWYAYQFGSHPPTQEVTDFLLEQFAYATKLAASNPTDPYYARLGQVLAQFEGILAGVNHAADSGESLSLIDLLLLEASGDLYDIMPAVDPASFKLHLGERKSANDLLQQEDNQQQPALSATEYFEEWHRMVSCSALIKMLPDKSDVYAGHTTWTSYQNMLRIYKNYDLGVDEESFREQSGPASASAADLGKSISGSKSHPYQTSHSSKPGMIYSKDDFYVLPNDAQKLVVIETTNGNMNADLYPLVTPHSLLTWQRIPMTNSLADNGADWTSTFSRHNSGTYANQWMVLDMKLFTPGTAPSATDKDLLWIVEVAPGIAAASDVTSTFVNNGHYWPSYNCPFTESVYVATGFQKAYETYGDAYSYTNCSRAQMLARDQGSIHTYEDFQAELRYNRYQTDPLSDGDPYNSISSRKDLRSDPATASTSGGIDAKVTSYKRMAEAGRGLSHAESGPTVNEECSVFQWSGSPWEDEVHLGQPDVWNFGFVEMDFYAH